MISVQTSCDCLCHSISVLPVCPRMSHFVQDLEQLLKVTRLAFVCLERGIYCFIYFLPIIQQKRKFHHKCTFSVRWLKVFFNVQVKCQQSSPTNWHKHKYGQLNDLGLDKEVWTSAPMSLSHIHMRAIMCFFLLPKTLVVFFIPSSRRW